METAGAKLAGAEIGCSAALRCWLLGAGYQPAGAPPKISVMALVSMPPPSISSTAAQPVEMCTISRLRCGGDCGSERQSECMP